MTAVLLQKELHKYSDKKKAKVLQGFFKTGPGEYAEGDIFIGVNVPVLRILAKKYQYLPFNEILRLLRSESISDFDIKQPKSLLENRPFLQPLPAPRFSHFLSFLTRIPALGFH